MQGQVFPERGLRVRGVEIINDENIPLWRKQLVEIEDVLSSLR
jgi:hypothetical protein